MNRIEPDEVVTAFAKHKMIPKRGNFYNQTWKTCCGIGVMCFDIDPTLKSNFKSFTFDAIPELRKRRGLSQNYITGFINGFDNIIRVCLSPEDYRIGHFDGQEAAKAVGL